MRVFSTFIFALAIRLTDVAFFVRRCVHVLNADRWSVVKRWPAAIKFEITLLELSAASPDHCYLAGLDYEMVCGCWSRGALAGGFAFRGDSRCSG